MTLKKYLRPEEAAEYLSKQTGHSITVRDLFDLVLEKKILPVFLKDCALIHYGRNYDDGKKREACFHEITAFFYLDDCSNRLVVLSGQAKASVAFLYENLDFESFGWEKYSLRGTRCYISSASLVGLLSGEFPVLEQWEMNVGQDENPVLFQLDQAMYPRAELDALIARHQADSTPAPAPVADSEPAPQDTEAKPEDLNAKARTTALQIIAALASYPDLLPLDEPYKSAQVLIAHADGTGQPLPSMETVAQWLKAANPK